MFIYGTVATAAFAAGVTAAMNGMGVTAFTFGIMTGLFCANAIHVWAKS